MKNCTGCRYADWARTAAGKLHPSGDGQCRYVVTLPPLPASMHWLSGDAPSAPRPFGGFINRRRDNGTHCTYYMREAA